MSGTVSKLQHQTWTQGDYFISTDPSIIPLAPLNKMLESNEVYWAKPLPEAVLRETLENSLSFGLYYQPQSRKGSTAPSTTLIGLARLVTDFTTFAYLTDVVVIPEYQGGGLGGWLIRCVTETVDAMPYLRRCMLITSDWERSVPFYENLMGMKVGEGRKNADGRGGQGIAVMMKIGRGSVLTE